MLTVAAILLLGLAFGPIYPTTLAIVTARFRTGTAASTIIAVGSLGGLLLPWLDGVLIEGPGPRVFAFFTASAALAMMGFFTAWRWLAGPGTADGGRKPGTIDR